jgi:hypothetical protein
MPTGPITVPPCPRCKANKNVLLKYQITTNNVRQFFWYCTRCKQRTDNQFLPHSFIKKRNFPPEFWERALLKDYTQNVKCVVCGNDGAERHHFAPQALAEYFGANWDKWPTAYLCTHCHQLWHKATTPFLPGYSNSSLAREVMGKYKK